MSSGRRQDVPEPNRLFLAHVLVVVRVQHVCPPVPELVGSLQRVLVGFSGEAGCPPFTSTGLRPTYTR
jgi:hypothetical protein